MARDRQRAKQRKARQEKAGGQPHAPGESKPIREDVPGSVEHVGESDLADAQIVAGADGEVAPEGATDAVPGVEHPEDLSDAEFAELEDRLDEVEESFEEGDTERTEELEEDLDEEVAKRKRERAGKPSATQATEGGLFSRMIAFLRASWAELQRVQWPDRRQVGQATAVVLGFVVVAGLFLGLADAVAQEIVDFII
ncbi:MAG: preprotein translocase subunit SecE [Solirubrobacteraceae bacterium]|nr:preprotein translocase subunit SecE [Solirubrobacteraceae bacterium]